MNLKAARRLALAALVSAIAYLLVVAVGLVGAAGSAKAIDAGGLDRAAARGIVALTNAARAGQSLPALAVDARLTAAAETYAEAMAGQDWFDHVGPDGSTIVGRAEAAGYQGWSYLAENLARGGGSPEASAIVGGWLHSAGHRDNLLSPVLQEVGVGCYVRSQADPRFWCAQVFGSPAR